MPLSPQNKSHVKSSSTIRSRRFQRTKRNDSGSKSNSSHSNCSDFSKFYIKNNCIRGNNQGNDAKINQKLHSKSILTKNNISSQISQSHMLSTSKNFQNNTILQQNNSQQIQNDKIKVSEFCLSRSMIGKNPLKYSFSTADYELKVKQLKSINNKIQQENKILTNKVQAYQSRIKQMEAAQNQIRNMKNLFYENKIYEYQQQILNLKQCNIQLEHKIEQLKLNNEKDRFSPTVLSQDDFQNMSILKQINLDESMISMTPHQSSQQLELQIQRLKSQNTKLHLFYNSQLRKLTKQYETTMAHKDTQYKILKNKFMDYLKQFKNNNRLNSSVRIKQQLIESKMDCDEGIFDLSMSSQGTFCDTSAL